jgi:predicted outer membrane lipoprotein
MSILLVGNTPWIIGTLLAITFFVIFEALAFKHGSRTNSLSHAVYTVGAKWPLSIFLMGMFAGGLAVHFFWHWCPPGSISSGMLQIPLLGG